MGGGGHAYLEHVRLRRDDARDERPAREAVLRRAPQRRRVAVRGLGDDADPVRKLLLHDTEKRKTRSARAFAGGARHAVLRCWTDGGQETGVWGPDRLVINAEQKTRTETLRNRYSLPRDRVWFGTSSARAFVTQGADVPPKPPTSSSALMC